MLRLTLRSGRDGRFLARVIDRNVGAFVLDYGDPLVVAEVSERALRGGFRVWVGGRWETAAPQDPHMLTLLAHAYAAEGYLVFLDQPDHPGRPDTVEERLPDWIDPNDMPTGSTELTLETTEDTDLLTEDSAMARMQSAQLGPVPLATVDRLPDLDEEDVPTEQVTDPSNDRP